MTHSLDKCLSILIQDHQLPGTRRDIPDQPAQQQLYGSGNRTSSLNKPKPRVKCFRDDSKSFKDSSEHLPFDARQCSSFPESHGRSKPHHKVSILHCKKKTIEFSNGEVDASHRSSGFRQNKNASPTADVIEHRALSYLCPADIKYIDPESKLMKYSNLNDTTETDRLSPSISSAINNHNHQDFHQKNSKEAALANKSHDSFISTCYHLNHMKDVVSSQRSDDAIEVDLCNSIVMSDQAVDGTHASNATLNYNLSKKRGSSISPVLHLQASPVVRPVLITSSVQCSIVTSESIAKSDEEILKLRVSVSFRFHCC